MRPYRFGRILNGDAKVFDRASGKLLGSVSKIDGKWWGYIGTEVISVRIRRQDAGEDINREVLRRIGENLRTARGTR